MNSHLKIGDYTCKSVFCNGESYFSSFWYFIYQKTLLGPRPKPHEKVACKPQIYQCKPPIYSKSTVYKCKSVVYWCKPLIYTYNLQES